MSTSGNATSTTCWNEWISFWSLNGSENTIGPFSSSDLYAVNPYMTLTSITGWDPTRTSTTTGSTTYTYSEAIGANGFDYATSYYTLSETSTVTSTLYAEESTSIWTSTISGALAGLSSRPRANATTPLCSLSSLVPQCQSLWEKYISALTPRGLGTHVLTPAVPICTQASVDSSTCRFLSAQYMSSRLNAMEIDPDPAGGDQVPYSLIGYIWTSSVLPGGSVSVYQYWPSSSLLAPSCSLGCGQCAITGGTVRLFYWPVPATAAQQLKSDRMDAQKSSTTVFTFGTSFVSPTVYLSYRNIYVSDSCGGVGPTYTETIVPLPNPTELSSLWMTYPMFSDATAFFNYTDLNTPVPKSIYDRQPRCASWSYGQLVANQADNPDVYTLACPSNVSYAPILGNRSRHQKLKFEADVTFQTYQRVSCNVSILYGRRALSICGANTIHPMICKALLLQQYRLRQLLFLLRRQQSQLLLRHQIIRAKQMILNPLLPILIIVFHDPPLTLH